MNVEETFKNVVGREMTPDEVTRYLKLQKEFEIPDTDAIWMMFIWFEFYQRIFEKFPENARAETEKVITQLRAASVAVTEATRDEVKSARDKAAIEIGKMQETAKTNIAGALGTILETEIREAVGRLQTRNNRPLHKKWLIAMGVALLITAGASAWGGISIHEKWTREAFERGVESGIGMAVPATKVFHDFMDCSIPGGVVTHSPDGNEFFCTLGPDPKTGQPAKWRIR